MAGVHPAGVDAGQSGQFRTARARALKARAQALFPEALTDEQAEAALACCRRPRDELLIVLLRDTGLRTARRWGCAGRTCTRRRIDARWAARSWVRMRTCGTGQPERRAAKSRFRGRGPRATRCAPAYADYEHERAGLVGEDGTEMRMVNGGVISRSARR